MSDSEQARVEAIEPPDMAEAAVSQGEEKAGRDTPQLLVLGTLAGAYIAFGGLLALVALGGAEALPHGVAQVLAGLVFTLGLILVILGGAELFTGNMLMSIAWAERRFTGGRLARAWTLAYAANFAGSLIIAGLAFFAATYDQGDGAVGVAALELADSKTELAFGTALVSGILGNMLVCLAVWLGYAARSFTDKVLAIIPPIAAFVAIGLEHSIANMFLLPYGLLVKYLAPASFWVTTGLEGADYASLTLGGLFANLIPVTLGNMVGGLLVAAAYWYVYLRRS